MSGPQVKEAPLWLNREFLENALKKSFKTDELKILDLEIKLATLAAENYGSQLFRASLLIKRTQNGTGEKLSIIIKLITPGELGKELENMQAYEKEEDAFETVLPVIDDILKRAYPDHRKLWADCYFHQKLPNYILILEDLRVRGFTLANRFEGVDMEHAALVLKSLAKFHAASLVWCKENPEKVKFYSVNYWNENNATALKKTVMTPFKILSEDVLNWTEFDKREIISKKLKNIEGIVLEKLFEMWKLNESKINVLLHGDFWINNFMFKYNPNGKLNEINFVDFQLMTINSPAMDLQYLIFSSIKPDLRFDYIDLFLQTYHETFEDTLKRLEYQLEKPFTFEQLKKDFEEKYFWGLVVLCVFFPIFLIPTKEAFEPDEFLKNESGENYVKVYKRESLRDTLIRGFEFFEKQMLL